MALEGPQLVSTSPQTRVDDALAEDTLRRALDLARQLEELLAETRSSSGAIAVGEPSPSSRPHPGAHSTRMARAMAAGLVDELEALVRPARHASAS
jgi:hypothetical protein